MMNRKIDDTGLERIAYAENQKRNEIAEKYSSIIKKNFKRCVSSLILGTVLFFGGAGVQVYQTTTNLKNPIVKKYGEMETTLQTLQLQRENLPDLKVPYETEEIRKHLDKYLGDVKVRTESLDKAVVLLQKDMDTIREKPEVKKYRDIRSGKSIALCAPGLLLMTIFPFYFMCKGLRKIGQERNDIQDLETK